MRTSAVSALTLNVEPGLYSVLDVRLRAANKMSFPRAKQCTAAPPTSESLIEDAVSVTPLPSAGVDCFTNTHPLWLPPTARGIYGGTFLSQCISAAQATVPADFAVYSIQTTFVRAGTPDAPLVYHVDRTSDGKNFAVRTVKCVQNEQVAFVAIVGLTRPPSLQQQNQPPSRDKHITHAQPMPRNIPGPPSDSAITDAESALDSRPTHHRGAYLTRKVGITRDTPPNSRRPHEKRIYQWFRARRPVSVSAGNAAQVQQAALAYMCDNYLIQAVPHVNGVYDFVRPPQSEADVGSRTGDCPAAVSESPGAEEQQLLEEIPASDGAGALRRGDGSPVVGMMVSLSHAMFFHRPAEVRVERWMLAELASYWSGDGRGVAVQKIWSRDGVLLASSTQEGVVRLAGLGGGNGGGGGERTKGGSRL